MSCTEVCLKIEIHEIHKMNEIHLPKHRNPQHLGLLSRLIRQYGSHIEAENQIKTHK